MKTAFFAVALAIAYFSGSSIGERVGKEKALKEAYNTRTVSDGLEMACATLWMGEQNVKHWKKENREK